MNEEVILTCEEEPVVELEYVEAAIKPETVGHITPTYEKQTVYPASGTVFGSVEVGAIPDPTEVKDISENGDHDVRRYGIARVNVQPELQTKTVTPTETQQAITADNGYDGLDRVEVNPIPSQYVVPSGSLDITANGNEIDVTDKASVNVNVPIPPEYIVPTGDKNITENGTYDISQYATATVNVGGGVFGTYFDAEKVRVTYTGEDYTGRTYAQATADLKALMPAEVRADYYSIAGFEIVSDSFEEGDWVAGTCGYDYYGQRTYYWVWTNGRAVRNQNNYVQNAKGNLRSGMVADIFLLRFK